MRFAASDGYLMRKQRKGQIMPFKEAELSRGRPGVLDRGRAR
jgi:hypothetical protein